MSIKYRKTEDGYREVDIQAEQQIEFHKHLEKEMQKEVGISQERTEHHIGIDPIVVNPSTNAGVWETAVPTLNVFGTIKEESSEIKVQPQVGYYQSSYPLYFETAKKEEQPEPKIRKSRRETKDFLYSDFPTRAEASFKSPPKKAVKKEEIILNKDEEQIVNIQELADELAVNITENKLPKGDYTELLNYYIKLILKHERKQKE